ncbi:MAG: EthD family reductase [Sinobacteraceae bacterium]|nr:EthD family reductase [Nevskiaceae bacterium]
MTKVSILYPNKVGGRFDFDYYVGQHVPRSIELLSQHPGFRRVTVERAVGGTQPESPPGYVAAGFYVFDTAGSFIAAFVLDPDGHNVEAVFHGPFERSAASVVITAK